MGDQITTVAKARRQRRLGALAPDDLTALLRAIRLQRGI
jgi:mRNA-degrading endonuclease toxin of MazEF toxin-antitoxin module